jgi:short-subunit dehydrogenase
LGDHRSNRVQRLQYGLVTGASSGIGYELVRQLVRDRGMTILATARRIDRLERLSDELGPERVKILAGDLTDASFRGRLWKCAVEFPGGVDLLVNNAGMGNYARFDEQDPTAIDQMIKLNVVALMDLTQRAMGHMLSRGGGQILEISSVLGFAGMPYSAAYAASKHAVNGLVKSVRGELKGTGVRIWAACPGRTTSEFSRAAMGSSGQTYKMPEGEPTERIVRAIVKGLDRKAAFIMPSLTAQACVGMTRWCPGFFDYLIGRWARKNRVPGLSTKQP